MKKLASKNARKSILLGISLALALAFAALLRPSLSEGTLFGQAHAGPAVSCGLNRSTMCDSANIAPYLPGAPAAGATPGIGGAPTVIDDGDQAGGPGGCAGCNPGGGAWADCPASTAATWQLEDPTNLLTTYTCSASTTAILAHNDSVVLTDTTVNRIGAAKVTCNNGALVVLDQVCYPSGGTGATPAGSCAAGQSVSWTVDNGGGNVRTCTGTTAGHAPTSNASNTIAVVDSVATGGRGGITVSCTAGTPTPSWQPAGIGDDVCAMPSD